jgi:ATP-dependent DNA helicase RecG
MSLSDSVTTIKGVGPQLATVLKQNKVLTKLDLINYFPRRYDDYSHLVPIAQLRPGIVTIEAQITQIAGRYVRRGLHITEAIATDATGSVRLVWFNQPYRSTGMKKGVSYYISGEFGLQRQRLTIQNPSAELASDFPINTARIIPVYREAKGLKSPSFRRVLREVIPEMRSLKETLPAWIVEEQGLLSFSASVEQIHFPSTAELLAQARRRLGFEEVFELSLAALLNKQEQKSETAVSVPFDKSVAQAFVSELPFQLTDDQRRVIWQIYKDMESIHPMNRLVEGDVGSGKTVVAAMAALMALQAGFQVAYMAPTELLARQHTETIKKLLSHTTFKDTVTLLVGSISAKEKAIRQAAVESGAARFIIGTQALIQDKVSMQKLGLVIVDEQHRFGVDQRKKLQAKAGHMPHVLHMTATPIPRSLALTLFGELDLSTIHVLPDGRKAIETQIESPNSRPQLYQKIDKQIEQGRQVFVVCPLIDESDDKKTRSVEAVYEELKTGPFRHRRVGLLHGKLKGVEKERIMQQFVTHELDILVSTTVIEVGVNVPNATVMLIESAERFGLAQIHQLRGRVGRGEHQAYCFLMTSDSRAPSVRLKMVQNSTDGFQLAEYDLELRGPGAIYGSFQHGALDLRIAKLSDQKLIQSARKAAQDFIDRKENLLHYTHMAERVSRLRAVTNLN